MNLLLSEVPTVSTDAYAAGDSIGGLIEINAPKLKEPNDLVLHSVQIADADNQRAALDLVFFKSEPGIEEDSTTAITDNAAIALDTVDLFKIVGVVSVSADDYISFAANAVATVAAIGLPIDFSTSSIFYAIRAVGTPTFTADDSLQITLNFL